MSSGIDSITQLGNDIIAHKYHALATGTILFYDYFLTLADEVKYAWSGNKSWTFWLFIVNRYFPMTWQFWQLTVSYAARSSLTAKICEKSSFYSLIMFVVCTLIAQIVVTTRIYVVTMKNIPIGIGFAVITVIQCVLGVCMTVLTARKGALPQPQISLEAFHLCVFLQPNRGVEVAYTSLSLLYDALAFSIIVFWARRLRAGELRFSTILDTIAEDATWYFMVIFTSHFVLVMTLNLGRVTIQLLPGTGVLVYLPVMISRIILSLKKAADPSSNRWILTERVTNGSNFRNAIALAPMRGSNDEEDTAIPLDTFRGS